MTDDQQAAGLDYALTKWRVRSFLNRDRLAKIAGIVWPKCEALQGEGERNLNDPVTPSQRQGLIDACIIAVETAPNYQEIVGSFPLLLFGWILKVIIPILIDWWLGITNKLVAARKRC